MVDEVMEVLPCSEWSIEGGGGRMRWMGKVVGWGEREMQKTGGRQELWRRGGRE